MSSPKADQSIKSEETFNHTSLVPRRFFDIPCYKAASEARLSVIAQRGIGLFG